MKLSKENFQPIAKYLRPYKKAAYITVVFVFFENLILIISPIIFGKAVDTVVKEQTFRIEIAMLMLLWALLNILSVLFAQFRIIKSNFVSYKSSQDLFTKSVAYLIKLPLSYHKNKKIGEIIQRFSRADEYLYNLIDNGLFQILPNIVTSFLAFFVIGWINWKLSLIYLLFIIIFIFATVKKTNPIIKTQKRLNKIFEKAYGDIYDRTSNILNVKSNSTEERENERNLDNFQDGFKMNSLQVKLWTNLIFWQNLTFTLGFLALYGLAIYFISNKTISIGQFVMLISYVNLLSSSVNSLGWQYKRFQESLVTIARADKIFNETPENYDDPLAVEIKDVKGEVEFESVCFSYDKEDVLQDISFKAEPGQMVAIVGKSGEGKSTLVDLISRYNVIQSGKIKLDGIDIKKIRLKNLRDQIAIVPQEVALFNDTIKNNISYSNQAAAEEVIKKASQLAHCDEFIEKFPKKYDQMVGERGIKLSTGQKQRVAIARAILRNPKILILDEATSALDSESEMYVQAALEEVMKGRTTFVIAHRLSTIKKADLIIVLENGKIVERGDHAELLNQGGVYRKLSEMQKISV